jgi:Gam-like protein
LTDTDTMLDVGLDEWLDAPTTEPDWEPDGQADANRLLGVIRHIDRQLAEDNATWAAVIEDAKRWRDARAEVLEKRRDRLVAMLEGWARMRHAWSGGRELTWKLPNGELKLRPQPVRCEPDASQPEDDVCDQLITAGHDDLVKTSYTLRKGDAKKVAVAGERIEDYSAPEGYAAHQAVMEVADAPREEWPVLPGVVLLQPINERKFSAVPTPVLPPEIVR